MVETKVGIWGIGPHVRRNILPACLKADGVRVTALHSRNGYVLADVAEETGATAYSDVSGLLGADDVDVVYLALPTGLHAEAAMRVIESGKNLWCEKPMSATLDETVAITEAARASGVIALETDMFLHHPQFAALEDLVNAPETGSLLSITARFGFPHRPDKDFRYSRRLGGGALLDVGYYPVAAAVGLLGAGIEVGSATLLQGEGYEVDTGGTAMAFQDRCSVLLDWGFGRSYRSEIDIWCEGAIIQASRAFTKPAGLETQVTVRYQSGQSESYSQPAADHFALMLSRFADITSGAVAYDPTPQLERARLVSDIRKRSAGSADETL